MLLSIIIPVHNTNPKYLKKCVNSIISQKSNNIEIIIINDFSINIKTINYLKSIKNNGVKVINNSKNIGLGASRNLGFNISKGEYIWFIDSDDWISNNALSIVLNKIKNEKKDIFYFNFKYVYKNKIEYHICDKVPFCSTWSKIYNRKFLINNKIKHSLSKLPHEDEYFNLQVLYYAKSLYYIDNFLYFYNKVNDDTITKNLNINNSISSLCFYILEFLNSHTKKDIKKCENLSFKSTLFWRYCMLYNDFNKLNVFIYLKYNLFFIKLIKFIDWKIFPKKAIVIYFPIINLILYIYKKISKRKNKK